MPEINSADLLKRSTKGLKDSAKLLKAGEKLKEDVDKANGR